MRIFIYTVIGIVAAAVIAGFFIVGSPKEERLRRFDERRVQDLQSIQSEIINYWLSKEKLPENLGLLKDDIRGIVIPKDPETAADYQYQIKGVLSFSLCANFDRQSLGSSSTAPLIGQKPVYPADQNWSHSAGLVCFERTIDKDIYRPQPKG